MNILPKGSLILRKAVGDAEGPTGLTYECSISAVGASIVRSTKTGRWFTLPWADIVAQTIAAGVTRPPPTTLRRCRPTSRSRGGCRPSGASPAGTESAVSPPAGGHGPVPGSQVGYQWTIAPPGGSGGSPARRIRSIITIPTSGAYQKFVNRPSMSFATLLTFRVLRQHDRRGPGPAVTAEWLRRWFRSRRVGVGRRSGTSRRTPPGARQERSAGGIASAGSTPRPSRPGRRGRDFRTPRR